jgi:hypothetical protein
LYFSETTTISAGYTARLENGIFGNGAVEIAEHDLKEVSLGPLLQLNDHAVYYNLLNLNDLRVIMHLMYRCHVVANQ